jgi:hypothetical protein
LYSSAAALISVGNPFIDPPANKTVPFGSKVAVWPPRGVIMLAADLNVPGDCASVTCASPIQSKTTELFMFPFFPVA